MRSVRRIAAGLLTALGCLSAYGQAVGDSAPEIKCANWTNHDGSLSLERYKGRIVVLVFVNTADAATGDLFTTLNDLHKRYSKAGFVFIAVTREKKEAAEGFVKGKEVQFIVGYEFDPDNKWSFTAPPEVYLIDTFGRIGRARFHGQDALEDKMKEQREKTPPAGGDTASIRNRLTAAKKHFDAKEYAKAWTLTKAVIEQAGDEGGLGDKAKEMLKEIEEKIEKEWIPDARTAINNKEWDKAAKILAEIVVRMEGHKLADDAQGEVARMQADRDGKGKIKTAIDNAKGQILVDQAADLEASKQYLDAILIYRDATEKYPDTEAAKTAQTALDKIASDPTIVEVVKKLRATEEADRWYDIAERCERVDLAPEAREWYQKIIDTHPTTKAASRARARLKEMPTESPSEGEKKPDATQGADPKSDGAPKGKDARSGEEG